MDRLVGSPQHYAWGSRTMIPELIGAAEESAQPLAELWFGAHPANPSTLATTGEDLLTVIDRDRVFALGPNQARLPFLVKILAAEQPLSLQAHPSKEQAELGFAAENAAGIPITAPERNFRDDNHKPELLIALTQFRALAGFRRIGQVRELFTAFSCPQLDTYKLMVSGDEEEGLRALLTTWVSIPQTARTELIAAVMEQIDRFVERSAAHPNQAQAWILDVATVIQQLYEQYPDDIGIVVSLLLNVITLQPGEAMFVPARQLHSYVHGLAVEVQANSDNVLRGGLTGKHVDVPALVKLLDFTSLPDPRILPTDDGDYPVPTEEFQVHRIAASGGTKLPDGSPLIAVCVSGSHTFSAVDGTQCELRPGEGLWSPAKSAPLTVSGDGVSFVVTAKTLAQSERTC